MVGRKRPYTSLRPIRALRLRTRLYPPTYSPAAPASTATPTLLPVHLSVRWRCCCRCPHFDFQCSDVAGYDAVTETWVSYTTSIRPTSADLHLDGVYTAPADLTTHNNGAVSGYIAGFGICTDSLTQRLTLSMPMPPDPCAGPTAVNEGATMQIDGHGNGQDCQWVVTSPAIIDGTNSTTAPTSSPPASAATTATALPTLRMSLSLAIDLGVQ